jgi:hypothetical protein
MMLGRTSVSFSIVDRRISAVGTPSASLYRGHTAVCFVFDASRAASLNETRWCIEQLQIIVGPAKFNSMPKILVCHKSDLLPSHPQAAPQLGAPAEVVHMPAACHELLDRYGMSLVFTTSANQESVDLGLSVVVENWP